MFGWRGWNEISWAQTYGTSLTVFISHVEIKSLSVFLKLTTFHKKSLCRGKKKIKCQVYASTEHNSCRPFVGFQLFQYLHWGSEKRCSLDWQIDHRTCHQNTSVITGLEGSLPWRDHCPVWQHWQWAAQPRGDPWTAIDFASSTWTTLWS